MLNRNSLRTKVWQKRKYYDHIRSVVNINHPGLEYIIKQSLEAENILDVGCGDGTKLNMLGTQETKLTGCDISTAGIRLGKEKYPKINFRHFDGEGLPFEDQSFDLVTTMFALEHTEKPEILILEMLRVTKRNGYVIFLAPNYGAPNRASTNFKGSRLKKLFFGFFADFKDYHDSLGWNSVSPEEINIDTFESDSDTTIEPYLGSLKKFLENHGTLTIKSDSLWGLERENPTAVQKIFHGLSNLGLIPIVYWGPHLFIMVRKII